MKFPLLVATATLLSLIPAFAITDAEITPAALAGKTLTFTINTGGGIFAPSGIWTGTFGNPTFTVTALTGPTANLSTTHSTTVQGAFTVSDLPKYVDGSGPATLTLFTDSGIGKYELNLSPVGPDYQLGTFTIGETVTRQELKTEIKKLKQKLAVLKRSGRAAQVKRFTRKIKALKRELRDLN